MTATAQTIVQQAAESIRKVSAATGVPQRLIHSADRGRHEHGRARHAVWLDLHLKGWCDQDIATAFRRDVNTVAVAIRTGKEKAKTDPLFKSILNQTDQ